MSNTSMSEKEMGDSIVAAITKAFGSTGASLEEIKQYLSSNMDKIPDLESIKSWLNDAVDKGILTLTNGKYKMKNAEELAEKASQSVKSSLSGCTEDDDHGKCTKKENAKRPDDEAK